MVEAGTLHLVEAFPVVTSQVEEASSVVTLQVEEDKSVVTLQVEEATSVVTLQVEEVDILLVVEAATVIPVEAAGVVTGVAVPIVRLRVPAPAPVLHGEYGKGDRKLDAE